MPVLYGLFIYMGVSALRGVQVRKNRHPFIDVLLLHVLWTVRISDFASRGKKSLSNNDNP